MTDALSHDYFCYVISNKFPRLLAEREIIANAFFQRCLGDGSKPNPDGKGTKRKDSKRAIVNGSCFREVKLKRFICARKGLKKLQDEAEERFVRDYEAERDRAYYEKYRMGYEEYLTYSSQELPEILRKYHQQISYALLIMRCKHNVFAA